MNRVFLAAFFLSQTLLSSAFAAVSWDAPKKIGKDTVFLGEKKAPSPGEEAGGPEPSPGEKGYAWRLLERGNNFLLAGRLEEASIAFSKSYEAGGPTRVLSGFKLVEVHEKLGRLDEAVAVLDEMKRKYLASTKEFGEAARLRAELEDLRRKSSARPKEVAFSGREWLETLQVERMKYTLDAMEVLRAHGVPLKEPAQKYIFMLDEYFIAHPDAPADDGAKALAVVVYEDDQDARVPIDRWRLNPDWLPPAGDRTPPGMPELTGADWVRWTHKDKMSYILQAMEVLKSQSVPMQRSPYAYEYAVDEMFTRKPEWPASDAAATLATVLYETEPDARDVLEALRLR